MQKCLAKHGTVRASVRVVRNLFVGKRPGRQTRGQDVRPSLQPLQVHQACFQMAVMFDLSFGRWWRCKLACRERQKLGFGVPYFISPLSLPLSPWSLKSPGSEPWGLGCSVCREAAQNAAASGSAFVRLTKGAVSREVAQLKKKCLLFQCRRLDCTHLLFVLSV